MHQPTHFDKRDNSSHLNFYYSFDLYQVTLWVIIFVRAIFFKIFMVQRYLAGFCKPADCLGV
jgi:hypothetical protein